MFYYIFWHYIIIMIDIALTSTMGIHLILISWLVTLLQSQTMFCPFRIPTSVLLQQIIPTCFPFLVGQQNLTLQLSINEAWGCGKEVHELWIVQCFIQKFSGNYERKYVVYQINGHKIRFTARHRSSVHIFLEKILHGLGTTWSIYCIDKELTFFKIKD